MPQIIVTADTQAEDREPRIMFRERVSPRDFESEHFARHLVERIGWAVGDAHVVERAPAAERELAANSDPDLEPEPDVDPLPMPALSPVVPQAW